MKQIRVGMARKLHNVRACTKGNSEPGTAVQVRPVMRVPLTHL